MYEKAFDVPVVIDPSAVVPVYPAIRSAVLKESLAVVDIRNP